MNKASAFNQIIPHRHGVAVELNADLHHTAAFSLVGKVIALAVDEIPRLHKHTPATAGNVRQNTRCRFQNIYNHTSYSGMVV